MQSLSATIGQRVYHICYRPHISRLGVKTLPALIIMDIGMPEMDGLTTLWQMRRHDELATVPVIILTAYDSDDLRGEAVSAGCQSYLPKPFEPEKLKALVYKLLS